MHAHSIRVALLYRSMTLMTASAKPEVRTGENVVHFFKSEAA
jgi:hypothetical protein